MTAREKLKMLFALKKEKEEIKTMIEKQIEEEITYKETIQSLTSIYKPNYTY